MPDETITLYVESGILRIGDKEVLLSPQEARILEILAHHPGFFISQDRVIMALYGDSEPESATSAVRVAVFHLRKKITPLGCNIETKHGSGWRLHPKIEIMQK
jgi:two-component system OmpR family response regulator